MRSDLDGSAVEEVVTGRNGPGEIALYFDDQYDLCSEDLDRDNDADGKDLAAQAVCETGVYL